MRSRVEFHEKLVDALGTPYVYFQPPENLKLHQGNKIVYSRSALDSQPADDGKYVNYVRYTVTLISKDPDWSLITELPFLFHYCTPDRPYSSDGLNYHPYTIYY